MNYIILATSIESGGGKTILHEQLEIAKKDSDNLYVFFVSTQLLTSSKNINVICYDNFKKNWIIRLFNSIGIYYLLKTKYKDFSIVNMNYTHIPFLKTKQKIILHQSLPFSMLKFNIINDFYLWFIKNVRGFFIKRSLKKVDFIEVPSNWLKEEVIRNLKINPQKIILKSPMINFPNSNISYQLDERKINFFYPSSLLSYKNHEIIIQAISNLGKSSLKNIRILFTIDKNEFIKRNKTLYDLIMRLNLPIEFIGFISRSLLPSIYIKSTLIYPSKVEAYGLPLAEAKYFQKDIISIDKPYSNDILSDYNKVFFFQSQSDLEIVLKNYISENTKNYHQENK